MSILILHRNPFEPFPYERWLRDYDGEVVVLAARDKLELFGEQVPAAHGFAHLEVLDDFDDEELIRARALKLVAEYGTRHIVALHEADLILAARLREQLGLDGPRLADVEPFRDKALMKERLGRAGVEVARHTLPRTAQDAHAFAEQHGFPVVFKDRTGFNSIGLRILRDREELESHTARVLAGGDARDDLLMEAYVPGRMCHVDGLVVDGRTVLAWPSQYQYDLASYGTDAGARVDLTLDPDDPLTGRLLDVTERALAALRRPDGRMREHAFHAEIFHTPDDRLVLCEIACRSGGAKTREVLQAVFGLNIGEYATRAELGLPLPLLEEARRGGSRPQPRAMAGQVLMMKRPGHVRALAAVPDDPWVERFWLYGRVGQVISPAAGSADFLTCAVASAPTRTECERRLRALGARFEAQTEIVPAGSTGADASGDGSTGADAAGERTETA
ncbi:hypothetical protein HCC61_14820 [Streptomyces sp. HNM0575]|uniref:ATP-binding protein n=1 Tax=Streptomyces sp. HNM0575 TaxID=2716338 RepID=UPI00145F73D4|nr:hypothetical protein [Streptomyces sp. HNM0575]NLU73937.1 hypothetical protein [Streptomyces sp. HNM0575]